MTEQDLLKEIEARANAATPSKWETSRWFSYAGVSYVGSPIQASFACIGPTVGTVGQAEADCAFIAHAREDVPKLIAEVRRLRELIRRVERKGFDGRCLFCHGAANETEWADHRSGCEAFVPDGELR